MHLRGCFLRYKVRLSRSLRLPGVSAHLPERSKGDVLDCKVDNRLFIKQMTDILWTQLHATHGKNVMRNPGQSCRSAGGEYGAQLGIREGTLK